MAERKTRIINVIWKTRRSYFFFNSTIVERFLPATMSALISLNKFSSLLVSIFLNVFREVRGHAGRQHASRFVLVFWQSHSLGVVYQRQADKYPVIQTLSWYRTVLSYYSMRYIWMNKRQTVFNCHYYPPPKCITNSVSMSKTCLSRL